MASAVLLGGVPIGRRLALNSPEERWRLDSAAFARLLAAFSADPAAAAELYEKNHLRLVRYFDWQGLAHAEELADRCLDVSARKLAEGQSFSEPGRYLLGIARRLRLEAAQEQMRMSASDRSPAAQQSESPEQPLVCLDKCLAQFAASDPDLLLQYYTGEQATRIDNRKKLAASLGLQINTLRNLALRLRLRVEECVGRCLEHEKKW